MGRVNTPVLTEEQAKELENGLRTSKKHAFRMRCQCILLKSDNRKSKDVGLIVGMCHVSVNTWLRRYKKDGIAGLETKVGRGRKPKIDKIADETAILTAVKANRQRLQTAKAEWESQSGKTVSRTTLKRFLKVLVGTPKREDINE
jgi:transposase